VWEGEYMTKQVGSTETQKALDMNGKLGLMATWAKRFGVITNGSMSVDDIKNTSTITRQGGIIAGLNTGLTTEAISNKLSVKGDKPSVSSNSDPTLQTTLAEPNSPTAIALSGKEKLMKTYGDIEKYKGEYDSFRYIVRDNGKIIAATKIMSKGKLSVLSTIYVDSEYRSKGIASKMMAQAKKDFKNLQVDSHLTQDGAKFFGVTESTIQDIKDKYKDSLEDLYISQNDKKKQLGLSIIKIKKDLQKTGTGTKVMKDIIGYADSIGYTIILTPSTDYGASSIPRLKDFYKRFGFVENKGKNADYTISDSMYRLPKNKVAEGKFMKQTTSVLESLRNNRKLSTINESSEQIDGIIISIQNSYSTLEPNVKPPNLDSDLNFISSTFKNLEELVQEISAETDYQKRTDRVKMAYSLADKAFQIAHALYHNAANLLCGIPMGDWTKSGSQDLMNLNPGCDEYSNPILAMLHSLKEYLKQSMTILAQNM
jgi:GNAT superfamily N-acetyltransferase